MDTSINAQKAGTIMVGSHMVNRMGYGAMRLTGQGVWGEPADNDAAIAVLKRAVELGVNFIDTADAYGPEVSENLIAEALAPYEGVTIATKGGLTRTGPNIWIPDCSPEHLRKAIEGSLERLELDQIPVYQLHTVDDNVAFEDSLNTLIDLKQEGKIQHIGLSNVEPDHLKQALQSVEIVSVQNHYNIGNREHEAVLSLCEENGIAFIPYFPLGSGNLTAPDGPLAEYAQKYRATTGQIALAWLLKHSQFMLPIPGTSSIAHLEENIAAANIEFDTADLMALDQFKA